MKIFGFINKVFFVGLTILSSFTNATTFNWISMKNQECNTRPQVVHVNSNNPIFYPFSIKTSKSSGNCNNINNLYAEICVPDVIKDFSITVYNLMSITNETRFIEWHETCKCKCRLDAIVCNNKQGWNKNKCRCNVTIKEYKGVCDKGFIWNPSNCECDKTCDIDEYLDYGNCKCRKKWVDKLIDECTETIEEVRLI